MKKLVLIAALALVTTVSCSHMQSSAPKSFEGEVTTVNAIDENYKYPIDENYRLMEDIWIETLSDSVDYLILPSDFPRTSEIDSLVDFYNIAAATHALHADSYLHTRGYRTSDDMPRFDDSRVSGTSMAGLLHNLAQAIRNPYDPDNDEAFHDELQLRFGELNDSLLLNYFEVFIEKVDSLVVNKAMDKSQYIENFASLSEKVWKKEMKPQCLLDLCLKEKYFIPQTVLAGQYSLACYAQKDSVHTRQQSTGLLQSLLEAEIYSPFLPEIWRMWRCRIQNDALSMSNDGEIHNHFYNEMRNKVALTLLREYTTHYSSDALFAFLSLATVYNIIRNGSFIGNYVTVEDMNLFWSQTSHD